MTKAYYDGGFRAVVDGAPVRLAFKPSAAALEAMRGKSGTKPLREAAALRFAETSYDPVAAWLERRCSICGERSDAPAHERLKTHTFKGVWRYHRSVSGVLDPRTFDSEEDARRG